MFNIVYIYIEIFKCLIKILFKFIIIYRGALRYTGHKVALKPRYNRGYLKWVTKHINIKFIIKVYFRIYFYS